MPWGYACLGGMHAQGGVHAQGGMCGRGACMPGGSVWLGGMCGGQHASPVGVCMAAGMHGQGSCMPGKVMHAWQGHACLGWGAACHACPQPDTTRYGLSMSWRYASYWNAFLLKKCLFSHASLSVNAPLRFDAFASAAMRM